jgi:hypothetical protein
LVEAAHGGKRKGAEGRMASLRAGRSSNSKTEGEGENNYPIMLVVSGRSDFFCA